MKIIQFEKKYSEEIANLHSASITTGFLSHLSINFLKSLYVAISKHPDSYIVIAIDEKEGVEGFIAGTTSTTQMYRWVLKRYFLIFSTHLIKFIVCPKKLKNIFETLFYTKKDSSNSNNNIEAELLTIAVNKISRGKGIGRELVKTLEDFFYDNSISHYKVVTYSKDPVSNAFYKSCGFQFSRSFNHHGNILNEYVKTIS